MTAAVKLNLISIEEYLAGELNSPIKHEYLGGVVYAMARARIGHNLIKGNIFSALLVRLRGKRCMPYDSDNKVRIELATQTRFYYPDFSVTCSRNSPDRSYVDDPVMVVEVLSESTRRIDAGEKKDAYLMIQSMRVYMLVEQESAAIVVFRKKGTDFEREVYSELDAVIPLSEIDAELPLSEIYEDVQFVPETDLET